MNFLKFMLRYGKWTGKILSLVDNVVTEVAYYEKDGRNQNWNDFMARTEKELARYESS